MQMYVNYFDRFVKTGDENSTIGILLCKQKNKALVEMVTVASLPWFTADETPQAPPVPVQVGAPPPQLPTTTWFAAPAPNPFSRTTTLSFALARGGAVELGVYGVDGRKVATLVAETREPGQYQVNWDGRDGTGQPVRPGMYYARLVTPEGRFTRTLVLMR